MKIYELKDEDGKVFAFEISNIGRIGVLRIVRTIPGVNIIRSPRNRFLSRGEPEEFCEFELEGQTYIVFEPFGDSSRFWVGPKLRTNNDHIDNIRMIFENHKSSLSSLFRRIIEN